MTDVLSAQGLQKSFGGLLAINNVSFSVQRGSIFGVIGPNGAGKSTLFDLLTRVQDADSGAVLDLDGVDLISLPAHDVVRRGIARTFQHTQLLEDATVSENIGLGRLGFRSHGPLSALLRTRRFRQQESSQAAVVDEVLNMLSLSSSRDTVVSSLPTLIRQMTSIGIALAANPRLLLLDEPLGGLLESEVTVVVDLLRQIRDSGVTILLIEHRMSAVMTVCDSLLVLDFGAVIASGSPEEIRANPRVIKAYLGGDHAP